MNKEHRIAVVKAINLMAEAKSLLEHIQSQEEKTYYNMPESFRNGEKGEAAQETISTLEQATTILDDVIFNLEPL